MDKYFAKINNIDKNLKEIIIFVLKELKAVSPGSAVTIKTLQDAYKEQMEWPYPVKGAWGIQICYLLSLSYISVFSKDNGTKYIYYMIEDAEKAKDA